MLKIFFLIVLFGSEISSASQAAVVGSINVDLVLPQSPSNMSFFPKPGETTTIPSTKLLPGGKGLNQAFALAKLGVNVSFNGNVGDDVHGDFIKTLLAASSLNSTLNTIPSASTGVGVVFLPRSGDASAIVSTGANGCWERVPHLPCISTSTSVLLLQREIPEETNILLAKQAAKANCPTFLDCGGSNKPISNELLSLVTFVSPNLSELGSLTSAKCSTTTSCILAAKQLISRGAKNVLVTRGSLPSILITDSDSDTPVITPPITDAALTVVDTTGAGDCFKAAFCFFHFIEKLPIQKALEFASLSGFLACTKVGVTSSPTISDLTATMLKLRGGEQIPKKEKFKFASRLNSFRDKHPSLPLLTWIELQGKIPSLSLIDFNYPQHLPPLTNSSLSEISSALKTADLKTGAVCLRFPSSMQGGAFTNPDEGIRAQAIQLTEEACEWAMKLNANEVVVWSAFCGYDYAMQADYNVLFDKTKEAFQQVCDKFPAVKVSLEFKPTDENTRFFAIPSTGAAVVLADAVNRPNFGLTLDFGHCLMAGENPAQSVALAQRKNMLFGVQLGDGYLRCGAEDGLIVGSVNTIQTVEFLLWLLKTNYSGHLYFDTFPRNEDPISEAEYNIERTRKYLGVAEKLLESPIYAELVAKRDAIAMLRLIDRLL